MSLDREMEVLRGAVGLTRLDHMVALRLLGEDAFSLLDALSTRPLFLREGQTCHTLFLNEDASPYADVYVSSGEDGYYLLAEGPPEAELLAHLTRIARERLPGADLIIQGLSTTHELWGLNGPFAWELLAAALGPSVLGMPYLTLLHKDDIICFRGGKTGEYGYDLLVSRDAAPSLRAGLEQAGQSLGLAPVSLAALDRASLENWYFCIRTLRETRWASPLTPLELQLQWRVDYERDFVGALALRARRAQGIEVRATCFCAADEVHAGQSICSGPDEVGEVLHAGWSPARQEWVGSALLRTSLAHPGITLHVATPTGEAPILTRTPPLLNNLSLHVDPHRHSYRTRQAETFPPLVVK